jgi:hypothetical protein
MYTHTQIFRTTRIVFSLNTIYMIVEITALGVDGVLLIQAVCPCDMTSWAEAVGVVCSRTLVLP